MLKTEEKKNGRMGARCVCTCSREIGEAGRVEYAILSEDGASRAEYGTPCEVFYTLVIRGAGRECVLTDVAREEDEAISLCLRFALEEVLPVNAEEVFEELFYA